MTETAGAKVLRKLDGVSSPFFFSSRRRHTRCGRDWSSDVCSSDLELFYYVAGADPVMQGLVGGLFIASMNLVGAVLVGVWRSPSQRGLDAALGFAAGVMLTAAFRSEERRVGKEWRCRWGREH